MKDPQKKRILLVEDQPNMAFSLQFNLQKEGFTVDPAATGNVALEKLDGSSPYDLVILDVMLPDLDGFQIARHIRRDDDKTHILMLTALGKDEERLKGFEAGVDDYITKPFHLEELIMRVRRMIKRSEHFAPQPQEKGPEDVGVLQVGPFELDPDLLQFKSPRGDFTLTAMEADVLKEFMRNPERVLSRQHLLDAVWGMKGDIETRTVDNFIVRLRRYIEEDPSQPKHLVSVRGRGYRLLEKTTET